MDFWIPHFELNTLSSQFSHPPNMFNIAPYFTAVFVFLCLSGGFIQWDMVVYASPRRVPEWSRHSRNMSRQSTPAAPMNLITQGTSGLVASSSLDLSSHSHHRKVSKKWSQQETHGIQRPCTGNWSGYINKQPSRTWLTKNTSWHSTNQAGTMSAQCTFQNPPTRCLWIGCLPLTLHSNAEPVPETRSIKRKKTQAVSSWAQNLVKWLRSSVT